jgi:hypothetical protein
VGKHCNLYYSVNLYNKIGSIFTPLNFKVLYRNGMINNNKRYQFVRVRHSISRTNEYSGMWQHFQATFLLSVNGEVVILCLSMGPQVDRLCGLVDRVPGCRPKGTRCDSPRY